MPLLGAHTSAAGGLHLAFDRLREISGEAMQIFTKNDRQWAAAPLDEATVSRFLSAWEASGKVPLAAHDSYLINLAATDPGVLERSVDGFAEELRRAARLRIPCLVAHPGSHMGLGIEAGLERFTRHMDEAITRSGTSTVEVLIETTAGQGTNLGARFEEIAAILSISRHPHRLAVCFDTCHVFAAGYDIRTAAGLEATLEAFDRQIGLERIRLFHVNDSKSPLGSRVDRHAHIGEGCLGLEAFRALLNHPRFQTHPMVLETPKGKDLSLDKTNLARLRALIAP